MATRRDTNPQKTVITSTGRYSPLRQLVRDAFRDFGDFSADNADPQAQLALVTYANRVLEDVMAHRYWQLWRDKIGENRQVSYYKSLDEKRDVPDLIIQSGLVAYYSAQQGSVRAGDFSGIYARTMAGVLWNILTNGESDEDTYSRPTFDKDEQGYRPHDTQSTSNDVDSGSGL